MCGKLDWEGYSLSFGGRIQQKKLVILLVVVFKSLNLGQLQALPLNPLVPNDSLFSELASIEKTSGGLLKFELSLFR